MRPPSTRTGTTSSATYDEATAKVYIDGVLRASTNSNLQLTANTQPLLIGRTTDNLRIFGGTLDEVAVYRTALSAARIGAHYQRANRSDTDPARRHAVDAAERKHDARHPTALRRCRGGDRQPTRRP